MDLIKEAKKDTDFNGSDAKAWFPLQNKYIDLIMNEAGEVSQYHLAAVEAISSLPKQTIKDIQSALYKACEGFKHASGLSEPVLSNEEDIWNYLNFYQIRLSEEFNNQLFTHVILEVAVKWEGEHAYEVVISNFNQVDYVGLFLCYPATSYADVSADEGNYALK